MQIAEGGGLWSQKNLLLLSKHSKYNFIRNEPLKMYQGQIPYNHNEITPERHER